MPKRFAPQVEWDPQVQEYLEAAFGKDNFVDMKASCCRPPSNTCLRVNTLKASTEDVIKELNSINDGCQAPVVPAQCHPLVPAAVMLPRQTAQGSMDYSLTGGKEVVITRRTGEAVLRGAPVYAPGVLACSNYISRGDLVAVSIAVEQPGSAWCGITRGSIINAAEAREGNDRSALYIGIGRAHMSRAEMFQQSSGLAVSIEQPVFPMPLPVAGLRAPVMLQNLPSVVAAMALKPTPGSRVLDMCASPGGKTTMLAQLMQDKGVVVALDRTHAKAYQVLSLAAELGLSIIEAYKMDATKAVLQAPTHPLPQLQQQQQAGCQLDQHWQCSKPPPSNDRIQFLLQQQQQQHQQQRQQQEQERSVAGAEKVRQRAARKQAMREKLSRNPKQPQSDAVGSGPGSQQQPVHNGVTTPDCQAVVAAQVQPERVPPLQQQQQQQQQQGHPAAQPLQQVLLPPSQQSSSPAGFPPQSFDAVLLDAPCSALGLRPRLLQTATPLSLVQCGIYTRKLLEQAVKLLAPGGRLVFSTCTLSPFENETSVRFLLDKFPFLRLVPAEPRIGGTGLVGKHPSGGLLASLGSQGSEVCSSQGADVEGNCSSSSTEVAASNLTVQHAMKQLGSKEEVWLTEEEAQLVQRFDPAGPQDTIGFFIAAFENIGSAQ